MARLPPMLRLVNPVAERAILVGDPGRALELAGSLLRRPLMCNHQRGLWGYTGAGADGAPLTVQSTGTGGPSAVVVLGELARAGVARVVRAGTAVPARPGIAAPGDLRAVRLAVPRDGASRALGASGPVRPDGDLLARLLETGTASVAILSLDLLPQDGGADPELPDGVAALDRQTAPLLVAAARVGLPAAAVVAFPAADEDDAARTAWTRALGEVAATALPAG